MVTKGVPNTWRAVKKGDLWTVQTPDGQIVATLEKSRSAASLARTIAAAPYMLETLKGVAETIGEEDLPDNGEMSGAAVSDMVRSAIELAG